MITITYTLGNGYSCSCCGQTWTTEEDFDADTTDEQLIAAMAKIGGAADDWRGIHRIYGYDGDHDELESKIESAIKHESKVTELAKKLKDTESGIRAIDSWFNSLESEKTAKAAKRAELEDKLHDLKQQFTQLTTATR